MRLMYDSVTAANIPASAALIAGYTDGRYVWSEADWQRFPTAQRVRITVFASDAFGDVLDVENGDATPQQAPGWLTRRRDQGANPTVYCNEATWPAVTAACESAGIALPPFWIAAWNNDPTIPTGAVAHQYQSTDLWDLSSVADYWPGIDPPPVLNNPVFTTIVGDVDVAQRIDFQVRTDPNGDGYTDLAGVDATKIISVIPNGQNPATGSYHKVFQATPLEVDGAARIPLVTDAPNAVLDVHAFVSA